MNPILTHPLTHFLPLYLIYTGILLSIGSIVLSCWRACRREAATARLCRRAARLIDLAGARRRATFDVLWQTTCAEFDVDSQTLVALIASAVGWPDPAPPADVAAALVYARQWAANDEMLLTVADRAA